jgi:3-polyprenyl-4-hydroxybenzoate decarboxylase
MNIDDLTVGQAKELAALFGNEYRAKTKSTVSSGMVGKKVIIRTYSAGVWFGYLAVQEGNEVILKDARRMWRWKAKESISLSACAVYGIDQTNSKICGGVESVWLEAIEVIPCTVEAIASIEEAEIAQAQQA